MPHLRVGHPFSWGRPGAAGPCVSGCSHRRRAGHSQARQALHEKNTPPEGGVWGGSGGFRRRIRQQVNAIFATEEKGVPTRRIFDAVLQDIDHILCGHDDLVLAAESFDDTLPLLRTPLRQGVGKRDEDGRIRRKYGRRLHRLPRGLDGGKPCSGLDCLHLASLTNGLAESPVFFARETVAIIARPAFTPRHEERIAFALQSNEISQVNALDGPRGERRQGFFRWVAGLPADGNLNSRYPRPDVPRPVAEQGFQDFRRKAGETVVEPLVGGDTLCFPERSRSRWIGI